MIAAARPLEPRRFDWRANACVLPAFVAAACACVAAPASAQVGAAVSVSSGAQFRGYSLSNGRPVALLDLSYDSASGAYAAVSASGVLRSDPKLEPLELQLNGGYARRLSRDITVDVGIVHSAYSGNSSGSHGRSFTEIYAGVRRGILSSRLAFSPHYFESGVRTAYGELDANYSPTARLHLDGHLGLLVPLSQSDYAYRSRRRVDWRLGLTHDAGPVSLHLIWAGGTSVRESSRSRSHGASRLIVGLSCPL